MLFQPVLPHWICQTNNVAAACTVEVERRRPLFDCVNVLLLSFFSPLDTLLMMVTPPDPRGRWACRCFTPFLHLYAAHTWRVPSWMEWGALQALNPPPSRLTCGIFLSSPRTPVQFTLGLTNYSLKTSGTWVVHNWHVSATGERSLILRACVSEPSIHVLAPPCRGASPLLFTTCCQPVLNIPH